MYIVCLNDDLIGFTYGKRYRRFMGKSIGSWHEGLFVVINDDGNTCAIPKASRNSKGKIVKNFESINNFRMKRVNRLLGCPVNMGIK